MTQNKFMRYVGPYGKGHHPAYIFNVGEVFYRQVIEIPVDKLANLNLSEWEETSDGCMMMNSSSGETCGKERVDGSKFCSFHLEDIEKKTQLRQKEQ